MYVAKYMSKKTERASLVNAAYLNNPGRHYGYHRASLIPRFQQEWIDDPTPEQIAILLSYANQCLPWINQRHVESFTLIGRYADHARELLLALGLTTGRKVA